MFNWMLLLLFWMEVAHLFGGGLRRMRDAAAARKPELPYPLGEEQPG
jgi:hypothetical protein